MAVPHDDLIEHEAEGCVCGPARVPIHAGDGTRSQLVIHRRLDSLGDEPAPVEQWEGGSARLGIGPTPRWTRPADPPPP